MAMEFSPPLKQCLNILQTSLCPNTTLEWKQYIINVFEQILKESSSTEMVSVKISDFIDAIPERLAYVKEHFISVIPKGILDFSN